MPLIDLLLKNWDTAFVQILEPVSSKILHDRVRVRDMTLSFDQDLKTYKFRYKDKSFSIARLRLLSKSQEGERLHCGHCGEWDHRLYKIDDRLLKTVCTGCQNESYLGIQESPSRIETGWVDGNYGLITT